MLHIYRASRLEQLADLLGAVLALAPPAAVLAPQRLVVAHLGIRHWLQSHLAGPAAHGAVAANIEFLLPGQWWLQLADEVLGHSAHEPWSTPVLRWRIHAALQQPDVAAAWPALEGAPARRLWLYAGQLARLYGEYQVYRGDWLEQWERGQAAPAQHAQAVLWRALRAGSASEPRVRREQRLLRALAQGTQPLHAPLHVFGVSHLPPALLQGLQALARNAEVHLYVPDPCRELWDDLRSRSAQLVQLQADDTDAGIGHPLLAALGRIGQDFTLALNASDAAVDLRAHADTDEGPTAALPLLARVQESIRRLQPAAAGGAARRDDASLRVHACHNRLRELEVLRDALLGLLAAHPDLEPRQIVVMAPDIQQYAPLLPAVFGTPGHWHDDALPWHVADVPLQSAHPLLAAWRMLLQLWQSRCTLDAVLGLLEVPALARAFGLEGDAARAGDWLRAAHVAWGLDAQGKTSFELPADDLGTLAFGLDRLLAGWLLGESESDTLLPALQARQSVIAALPPDALAGSAALAVLAGLSRLLTALRHWRDDVRTPRSAAQWSAWLGERLDECCSVAEDDAFETEAQRELARLVALPALEAAQAGYAAALDWTVIATQQTEALDQISARTPYIAAGVRFCGMVPQRTVPYRVLAVLGLNEGEFPRQATPASLDLLAQQPRRGDRSALQEDRYLFLEALMAARDALHLSYVAEGDDGQARNPAPPLGELLRFLAAAHPAASDLPWRVQHALQPYAPVYFEQHAAADVALRSYAAAWVGAAGAGSLPAGAAPLRLPVFAARAQAGIELSELRRFLRKPGPLLCRRLLGLRLPRAPDASATHEPLQAQPEPRLRLPAQVLSWALRQGGSIPATAQLRLARSGVLASGAAGALAWEAIRAQVEAALAQLRESDAALLNAVPDRVPCALALDAARSLGGTVATLRDAGDRHWLLRVETRAQPDYAHWLPWWLDAALLTHALPAARIGGVVLLHLHGGPVALHRIDHARLAAADVRDGLGLLHALLADAGRVPAWYLPQTLWTVAAADPGQQRSRAAEAWQKEQQYAPELALLLRGVDWIGNAASWPAFVQLALQLRDLPALREAT